jgi:5-methylthioadenosine/S-adenosylhomocysteine deaminase
LRAEGGLGPHLNLAHSVWLAPDEIELLGESGTNVVLNPQGNLKMKCGIAPIRGLQRARVNIALGCDNCSCSDAQNMFAAMKLFALLGAVSDPDPGPEQAIPALRAATEAGARRAQLADRIGRIAAGYQADLAVIDLADPSFVPLNSVARQLVHVEGGRGVRDVMVDGRWLMRDRKVVSIDQETVFEAVRAVMPDFAKDFAAIRARVARLQPWLDKAHAKVRDADVGIERLPRLS